MGRWGPGRPLGNLTIDLDFESSRARKGRTHFSDCSCTDIASASKEKLSSRTTSPPSPRNTTAQRRNRYGWRGWWGPRLRWSYRRVPRRRWDCGAQADPWEIPLRNMGMRVMVVHAIVAIRIKSAPLWPQRRRWEPSVPGHTKPRLDNML